MDKPPVVFVNGYQQDCPATFQGTYGMADQILQRNGQASLFFDNCTLGRVSIEELGSGLGAFLRSLRYMDGTSVSQVDVVSHSMGGLIVRSYLSGKQRERGVFTPPAETRIRKLVFLATPHFGAAAANASGAPADIQTQALVSGSQFLFDLATWNQGMDDLRGVDAIAVAANGGNGFPFITGIRGFDDSTVTLTSASLDFVGANRTRVVPHCHTTGIAAAACISNAPAIANITSDTHETARIILSFLNGTNDWRTIGASPASNEHLSQRGGVYVQVRNAQDRPAEITSATSANARLRIRTNEIVWDDYVQAGNLSVAIGMPNGNISAELPVAAGFTRPFTLSSGGPGVLAVAPTFSAVTPRAVAPGMFVSIYGTTLAPSVAQAPGLPFPTTLANTEVRLGTTPLPLHYVSPGQINAVLPENISGLIRLTIRNGTGERGINAMVEPAVPSLFAGALNAVTGALVTADAPLRPGDFVSLYLTGLGATTKRADGLDWANAQPEVRFGGQPCQVSYAGRAPGFVGLDQINCQLAANLSANERTEVSVRSGNRTSNVITLAVR
jgi:uncharacterized protein (TIGR03437 family)